MLCALMGGFDFASMDVVGELYGMFFVASSRSSPVVFPGVLDIERT